MIQRHDLVVCEDTPEGEFVRYTDHLAAIAEKDREIERLKEKLLIQDEIITRFEGYVID